MSGLPQLCVWCLSFVGAAKCGLRRSTLLGHEFSVAWILELTFHVELPKKGEQKQGYQLLQVRFGPPKNKGQGDFVMVLMFIQG